MHVETGRTQAYSLIVHAFTLWAFLSLFANLIRENNAIYTAHSQTFGLIYNFMETPSRLKVECNPCTFYLTAYHFFRATSSLRLS